MSPSKQKAHAELGASTSEIWLNCAGSVNLWRKSPPKKDSEYAREGTLAHELLEKWATHLRSNFGAFTFPKNNVNPGMIQAVRVCIDDLKKSWDRKKDELVIERKVNLSKVFDEPDMFGTVDIGIIRHFRTLEVSDYKHGSGVPVSLKKDTASGTTILNTQLVYYALGLAAEYDFNFKDVTLKIIQPRYAGQDAIQKVTVPMRELMSYIPLFKKGIARTKNPDARRTAGPWCRFCRARVICKEGNEKYRSDCRNDFDEVRA